MGAALCIPGSAEKEEASAPWSHVHASETEKSIGGMPSPVVNGGDMAQGHAHRHPSVPMQISGTAVASILITSPVDTSRRRWLSDGLCLGPRYQVPRQSRADHQIYQWPLSASALVRQQ